MAKPDLFANTRHLVARIAPSLTPLVRGDREGQFLDLPAPPGADYQFSLYTGEPQIYARLVAPRKSREFWYWPFGVAGIGIGHFYERNGLYGRLLIFVVHESQRGDGIGRALLREAEAWTLEKGATVMVVNSGHQRDDAHAFYKAAGYSATGLRFIKPLSAAV